MYCEGGTFISLFPLFMDVVGKHLLVSFNQVVSPRSAINKAYRTTLLHLISGSITTSQ